MADDANRAQLLLDRLELHRASDGRGQRLDAQAWIGGDLDKLWFKVAGERSQGKLGATRTEVLWIHAIATYSGLQAGVRHDFGDGPGRTWAAVGFQGLAPYWFDLQATAYVGQGGRTALRFESEYDLLLNQRLVLPPNLKLSLYGNKDSARGIGLGLPVGSAAAFCAFNVTVRRQSARPSSARGCLRARRIWRRNRSRRLMRSGSSSTV